MSEAVRDTKSERLKRHLVALIDDGLEAHQQLPTERELAEQFDISRLTVRRALDQLEHQGLVYRVQGAGTFVSGTRISKSFEFASFSEDMRSRGFTPGSLSVGLEVIPAGAKVGYALNLSPAEEVVHVQRVRTADGIPICFEHSYLPENLVPGLADGIGEESLYDVIAKKYHLKLERAEQTIHATVLDPDVAKLLAVPAFSPAFHVVRTGYDGRDRAIEYAESLYRGDRYSYDLSVTRRHS